MNSTYVQNRNIQRHWTGELGSPGSLETRGQGAARVINKSLEDCNRCSLYIIYFKQRAQHVSMEGHESLERRGISSALHDPVGL